LIRLFPYPKWGRRQPSPNVGKLNLRLSEFSNLTPDPRGPIFRLLFESFLRSENLQLLESPHNLAVWPFYGRIDNKQTSPRLI
jgi:hypothetical protein